VHKLSTKGGRGDGTDLIQSDRHARGQWPTVTDQAFRNSLLRLYPCQSTPLIYSNPPPVFEGSEFKDFIPMGKKFKDFTFWGLGEFFSGQADFYLGTVQVGRGVPEIFDF